MLKTSAVRRHQIDRKAEVCGSIGRRVARGFLCGFAYGTIGDTTTTHDYHGTGVAMKARKIRRWVVAGLAAAAIATGIFLTNAQSSASDIDWHMPAGQHVVR
jgi:hypothetical protein